jgi:pyruvate kinase
MDRIIRSAEQDEHYGLISVKDHKKIRETDADAITLAAKQVAEMLDVAAIVTFTSTGSTTVRAARERPNVPILGLTPDIKTARRIMLVWGVHSVKTSYFDDFDHVVTSAIDVARNEAFAKKGQQLVITAGVPFGTPGATNVLRIVKL